MYKMALCFLLVIFLCGCSAQDKVSVSDSNGQTHQQGNVQVQQKPDIPNNSGEEKDQSSNIPPQRVEPEEEGNEQPADTPEENVPGQPEDSQEENIPEQPGDICGAEDPEEDRPLQEKRPEPISYEAYLALDAYGKQAYFDSYKDMASFFVWYNAAKEKYEEEHPPVIVEGNGSVEAGTP